MQFNSACLAYRSVRRVGNTQCLGIACTTAEWDGDLRVHLQGISDQRSDSQKRDECSRLERNVYEAGEDPVKAISMRYLTKTITDFRVSSCFAWRNFDRKATRTTAIEISTATWMLHGNDSDVSVVSLSTYLEIISMQNLRIDSVR